ncbi:MAG TPA: cupin domain-containing protein [Chthoniobacterales bacterium]|nr:cupin domain-containing protein [Chthoniobacterales bacterium]
MKPETYYLPDSGWCPNSPRLPLLIYHAALGGKGEELAQAFEKTFAANGWPPAWRYTIFDYPHYHSTTHEVIGVFRGNAEVRLGDEAGFTAKLSTGDVLIIPAGVSHQRLASTEDFQGVGAYPEGFEPDEQRPEKDDLEASMQRIAKLAIPTADPLLGKSGPLIGLWSGGKSS